jgi:hypothetical protein
MNLTDTSLRVSELAFLVGVLNKMNQGGQEVHLGMIPFMKKDLVVAKLRAFVKRDDITKNELRFAMKVADKIGGSVEKSDTVSFQMYLGNLKVWKYSRRVDDKTFVIRLGIAVKREVGLQWQEFGKKWVRGEQMQNVEIQLRRVNHNLWEIKGPKSLEGKIKELLHRQYAA